MLPFTKRPGRGESSDVVEKDGIGSSPAPSLQPPASGARSSMRPPPMEDDDFDRDDDRTGILQSSVRGASLPPAPLPAAGRPASIPPPARSHRPPTIRPTTSAASSPSSIRPPPSSARASARDDEDDAEDDDGGRTVVRDPAAEKRLTGGGRRVVQKATPSSHPTSISPAAVIRKTQESARANGLMQGPPADLMDGENDSDEYTQAAPSQAARSVRNNQTEDLRSSPARSAFPPPISYEGPPSHRPYAQDIPSEPISSYRRDGFDGPPSPRSYAPPAPSSTPGHFQQPSAPSSYPASAMQATQQSLSGPVNPYAATSAMSAVPPPHSMPPGMMPPAASSRAGGMMGQGAPMGGPTAQMPAHFRMAQTGAIVTPMGPAHIDPPGTAITANTRVSGRPAISWAAALAAAGVFVGVVAVAIAQRGDTVSDTQASFVDPAHTGRAQAGQPMQADPTAPPVPTVAQPGPNALPPGLIGASPIAAQPQAPVPGQAQPAQLATPPVAATGPAPVPGMADPSLGLAAPQPNAAGVSVPAVAVPAAAPPPARVAAAAPRPAAAAPRPAAARRPVPATDDEDDDTPAPKPVAKASAGKKPAGKVSDADAETKAALEALQKAQLESSSSFSK